MDIRRAYGRKNTQLVKVSGQYQLLQVYIFLCGNNLYISIYYVCYILYEIVCEYKYV